MPRRLRIGVGATRLPQQAGTHGGRLRRRRHLGRAGARGGDHPEQAARLAGDRREQARRRHHHRRRLHRQIAARRLQPLAAGHHHARDQHGAVREAAVRLGQGLHLCRDDRLHATDAGRASRDAGAQRARADRAAQVDSRQVFLRLLGQRHHRPPVGRDAEARRGSGRAACAVQGQQPGDAGDPGRRSDVRVFHHAAGRLERESEQAARARRHHAEARRRGARRADHDRGRAAGLRHRAVLGSAGTEGHGSRGRAPPELRLRRDGAIARDPEGLRAARRRGDRHDAGGMRGSDRARNRQAGPRRQSLGSEARLKPLLPQHGRYDFVPLPERRDYSWPGGKRLAFLLTTNVEWFAYGAGLGHDPAKTGEPQTQRNYSWRDYGNRIGIWRLFDLAEELELPLAHNTNSLLYDYAPQIFARIRARGDEIVAHGRTNSENLRGLWEPDEERIIREVTEAFARNEKKRPLGWMGAGAYETSVTPDLLKEAGYAYLMDWPCDDQPIWMRTRSGPILSVPYPVEVNDSPAIVHRKHSAREFCDMGVDQFEEMMDQ